MICRALLVLLALAGSASAGCPPGTWFPHAGFCYYHSEVGVSWSDARTLCRSLGADLASIADQEVNSYVVDIIPSDIYIWLGLNDIASEGVFLWSDGSSNAFTNWGPGQPDGGTSQNCVCLNTHHVDNDKYYTKWHDSECTNNYWFMCKMEELSTQSTITGAE